MTPDDAITRAREGGLPTGDRDLSGKVNLRIGGWNPADPRSKNYAVGDIEMGLSVYELDADDNPVVPPEGEWAEDDLRDRMRSDEPKYLVQGELLAWGHDGEPLLGNPRVVGAYVPGSKQALSP